MWRAAQHPERRRWTLILRCKGRGLVGSIITPWVRLARYLVLKYSSAHSLQGRGGPVVQQKPRAGAQQIVNSRGACAKRILVLSTSFTGVMARHIVYASECSSDLLVWLQQGY